MSRRMCARCGEHDGEVVDRYRRVPADMSYRDWKAVYIAVTSARSSDYR
ncbi:MAG: hypothetical protein SR1Q7_00045 [Quinella sp. 1Q7]|nr:hypothetical protein [Quinella sp. 1Q7]